MQRKESQHTSSEEFQVSKASKQLLLNDEKSANTVEAESYS